MIGANGVALQAVCLTGLAVLAFVVLDTCIGWQWLIADREIVKAAPTVILMATEFDANAQCRLAYSITFR